MTVKEFKKRFPQYEHLEGDVLWDKMEDTLLAGDCWDADYSDGYVEYANRTTDKGVEVSFRNPKYWINTITGHRITNEKLEELRGYKDNRTMASKEMPLESFKFDILDFGKKD